MAEKNNESTASNKNPFDILKSVIDAQRRESHDIKELLHTNNRLFVALIRSQTGVPSGLNASQNQARAKPLNLDMAGISGQEYAASMLGPGGAAAILGGYQFGKDILRMSRLPKLGRGLGKGVLGVGRLLKRNLFGSKNIPADQQMPGDAAAQQISTQADKESKDYIKLLKENNSLLKDLNKSMKELLPKKATRAQETRFERLAKAQTKKERPEPKPLLLPRPDERKPESPAFLKKIGGMFSFLKPKMQYKGAGPTAEQRAGGLSPITRPQDAPLNEFKNVGGFNSILGGLFTAIKDLAGLIISGIGSAISGLGSLLMGALKEVGGLITGAIGGLAGSLAAELMKVLGIKALLDAITGLPALLIRALSGPALAAAIVGGVAAALNRLSKTDLVQNAAKEAEDRYAESPLYGAGQLADGKTPSQRRSEGRAEINLNRQAIYKKAESELNERYFADLKKWEEEVKTNPRAIKPKTPSTKDYQTRAAEIEKQIKAGETSSDVGIAIPPELPNPEEGRRKPEPKVQAKIQKDIEEAAYRREADRQLQSEGIEPTKKNVQDRIERIKQEGTFKPAPEPQPVAEPNTFLFGGTRGQQPATSSTAAPTSATDKKQTAADILGDLISSKESGAGGYNAFNRGTAGDGGTTDLSSITISEYLRRSTLPSSNPDRLFAVGRYQIIPDTMKAALQDSEIKKLGITESSKLTPEVQDNIFQNYLIKNKRSSVEKFLKGDPSVSADDAVLALAQEFAAVGVPKDTIRKEDNVKINKGESYYKGKGSNAAKITPEQMKEALLAARDARKAEPAGGAPMLASSRTATEQAAALTAAKQATPSTATPSTAAATPPAPSQAGGLTASLAGIGVPSEATSFMKEQMDKVSKIPGVGSMMGMFGKIKELPNTLAEILTTAPKDPKGLNEYINKLGPVMGDMIEGIVTGKDMGKDFLEKFKKGQGEPSSKIDADSAPAVALSGPGAIPFQARPSQERLQGANYLMQGSVNRDVLKDNAAMHMARSAAPPMISTVNNNVGLGSQIAAAGIPNADPRTYSPLERYQDRISSFIS